MNNSGLLFGVGTLTNGRDSREIGAPGERWPGVLWEHSEPPSDTEEVRQGGGR